jgi:hypothetical protein
MGKAGGFEQKNAHQQEQTAPAGDQQGLPGVFSGPGLFVVKPDEQKG